jgi:hypothetical protein
MSSSVRLDVEAIDIYQFANTPFMIRASLRDTQTNLLVTGEPSRLRLLLAFEGLASSEQHCTEHHPSLLEEISNSGVDENGQARVVVKIKDTSAKQDQKRFVVYLETYRALGSVNIVSAVTNPIVTVDYKLVLKESFTSPYVWYKDEGTKEKCISVVVKLINAKGELVTNKIVPLMVTLVYGSGQLVQPFSVLKVFQESPLIISDTGSQIIDFRVNEVSRNHRKQMFHLFVAARTNEDPSIQDISPATSIAFEVKSKRPQDVRKDTAAHDSTVLGPKEVSHAATRSLADSVASTTSSSTIHKDTAIDLLDISTAATNDEVSFDPPFKALFSLADWTKAAAQLLANVNRQQINEELKSSVDHLLDKYVIFVLLLQYVVVDS